jgi:protein phosphatase
VESKYAARTDIGRVRKRNEDAYRLLVDCGWCILADGMGGYHGGDVAARIAVDVVASHAVSASGSVAGATDVTVIMPDALRSANAAIREAAAADPALSQMGATIVVAVFLPGRVVVGHLGDSRLYRSRNGELVRLTRDHTVLQEQLDRGMISAQAAAASSRRGLLTRALGVLPQISPDLASYPAAEGDMYLLCTDGVTDMLDDAMLAEVLQEEGASLDARAEKLIDLANERGGRDNATVILARLQ